jgi:hypothetical protein
VCFYILEKLHESATSLDAPALRRYSLVFGICLTGYDLMPYVYLPFLAALYGLRVSKREKVAAVAWSLVPQALVAFVLGVIVQVPLQNTNTNVYRDVIRSYFSVPRLGAWLRILSEAPTIFVSNFLFSGFVFLPVTALLMFVLAKIIQRPGAELPKQPLRLPIIWIAANLFLLFAILNFAPPYESIWQFRGAWISRVYEPIFVVLFLLFLSGFEVLVQSPLRWLRGMAWTLTVVAFAGQCLIVAGLSQGWYLSDYIYRNFYGTAPPGTLLAQVHAHGARPWGFCDTTPGQKR